ncbi:MAG: hypothetical protein NC121_10600 [Blautia sp.]|nr:hypothetical protein [Blautia sp.]
MRIGSSAIGMESTRNYRETNVTMRRFVISQYIGSEAAELQTAADNNGAQADAENTGENKTESQSASVQEWQGRMQFSAGKIRFRSSESQTLDNIRQRTVRYIFDLLFSYRKDRLNAWRQENGYGNSSGGETDHAQQGALFNENDKILQPRSSSVNLRVLNYSSETIHMESESTTFSTVGTVKTADGREINFNVNVGMSREFQSSFSENLQLATFRLCDPLVINLDSDVADVKDQTFYFDLDADGEMDEVSQLGKGSGYLALDKNGDGVINDGNELFGTKSGNGFGDLAEYDEDGNGWIDENDAIWDKLKIWCKDENGKDVLYRLADKGVGAICLQNTATDFTLQGQGGKTQGVVRSTGVFLYENGLAGTIQHVDMAKYDMGA